MCRAGQETVVAGLQGVCLILGANGLSPLLEKKLAGVGTQGDVLGSRSSRQGLEGGGPRWGALWGCCPALTMHLDELVQAGEDVL